MERLKLFGPFFKVRYTCLVISLSVIGILTSCNTLENASLHGLTNGYYKWTSDQGKDQDVYLDVNEEKIGIYQVTDREPDTDRFMAIPLGTSTDSLYFNPMVFKKQSLDVDITTVFFKYRPSVYDLPAQLTTDLNMALYLGWRYDSYHILSKSDPLGRTFHKVSNRGYDFGVFAGPGTTLISPFTTQNKRTDEYNGMIIQTGLAGFIESNVASFGLALGYDYLLSDDREIWIYHNKPWVGFIVGIALN